MMLSSCLVTESSVCNVILPSFDTANAAAGRMCCITVITKVESILYQLLKPSIHLHFDKLSVMMSKEYHLYVPR